MENRLDPEKVREARKRVESFVYVLRYYRATERDEDRAADIELCLRALDEGREASAPFAEAGKEENGRDRWPHHDDDTLVESSHALVELTAGDFRRLAAFNELVSQEKPDDPA